MTEVLGTALGSGVVESGDANYRYGFHMPENYVFKSRSGVSAPRDRRRDLGR